MKTDTQKQVGDTIRGVVILIVVIWVVSFIFSGTSSSKSVTDTPTNGVTAITPSMSTPEKLKAIVTNAITKSAPTSGSTKTIRNIDVVPQIHGGYGVFVKFNAYQIDTTVGIINAIKFSMADIYKSLYTSNFDVRTASVAAYLPLTDKYGNTRDMIVYKTILNKSIANKVNWNIDEYVLRFHVLPGIWETTILDPLLNH